MNSKVLLIVLDFFPEVRPEDISDGGKRGVAGDGSGRDVGGRHFEDCTEQILGFGVVLLFAWCRCVFCRFLLLVVFRVLLLNDSVVLLNRKSVQKEEERSSFMPFSKLRTKRPLGSFIERDSC